MANRRYTMTNFTPINWDEIPDSHPMKPEEAKRGGSDKGDGLIRSTVADRESIDDEVSRARQLGKVAADLAEGSKDSDFKRQNEIDSARFGRDRQAASEDFGRDKEKMSLSSTLERDRMRDSDSYDRGKMKLGADLEEGRRSNALKSALNVLERYR